MSIDKLEPMHYELLDAVITNLNDAYLGASENKPEIEDTISDLLRFAYTLKELQFLTCFVEGNEILKVINTRKVVTQMRVKMYLCTTLKVKIYDFWDFDK